MNGQEVTIDGGNHILQCTAANVHPDTTVTWNFGDAMVRANGWTSSSETKGNGLVDLTSTINVLSIAAGSSNLISCYMNDADERHKRQTGPEILVSISMQVVAVEVPDQGSALLV